MKMYHLKRFYFTVLLHNKSQKLDGNKGDIFYLKQKINNHSAIIEVLGCNFMKLTRTGHQNLIGT